MFTPQESVVFEKLKNQFPEWVELIYVDYRDELSEDQLKMMFHGDWETIWDNLSDWEMDSRYTSLVYYIEDALKSLTESEREIYDNCPDMFDELRYHLEENDSSDWFAEIVRNSQPLTVMVPVIGEDHSEWHEQRNAQQIADALEIELTENLRETLESLICEAPTDLGMAYIVAELPAPTIQAGYSFATITNPTLVYGNPVTGGTWADQLDGVNITVKRDDMLIDGSWGYTVHDVYGGLDFGNSEITVTDDTPEKVAKLPFRD